MPKDLIPDKPGAEPLGEALRACRGHFGGAAAFSALVNLLYLTPTLYMMQVYDRVVPTRGVATLVLISVVALIALGTLAALDWLRGRLMVRAALRLDRMLSAKVLSRLVDWEGKSPASHALREFDNVRSAISGQAMLAIFDAPWTPIYLACCFLLHPAIGGLTLLGGIILFALAWANERDTRPRLTKAIELQNNVYSAQEAIAGQSEVVRALGMRRSSIARQIAQRSAATGAQANAQLAGGKYTGAIKFLRLVLQSAALGVAALLAMGGEISTGSIIASSVLLSRAVAPVETLVGAWPTLIQALGSWRTLSEMFAGTASVDRDRTALPDPRGRVELDAVSVRFPGSDRSQLRSISLVLRPGEALGVIGPSGSGKTTLARVIAGALKPQVGAVRLDGAEYSARDGDELARWIGYLPQAASLFAGTIKDNISRFAAAAGIDRSLVDEDAVNAAIAAGAHEMILRFPDGYDTILGPQGQGLSAGQAQRVALARALYRNPVLLVLDEPNSNLDQEGETALMEAVKRATARGACVVMIAHRAGVLARMDRLLVMRDGMAQMEGPREEILGRIRTSASGAREAEPCAEAIGRRR